jgi:hypothetical protein
MSMFSEKRYTQFVDIDLEELNGLSFSVYVVDKSWTYLFVNDFVSKNLGTRGSNLTGKNMWQMFPELVADPGFMTLRTNTEKGVNTSIITTSPINAQRLSITGLVLKDCTLFTSTILPKKEELLHELRGALGQRNNLQSS